MLASLAKNKVISVLWRLFGYLMGALFAVLSSYWTPSMPKWFFGLQWLFNTWVWCMAFDGSGQSFAEIFSRQSSWIAMCLVVFQLIVLSLSVALIYAKRALQIFDYFKLSKIKEGANVFLSLPYVRAIVLPLWLFMAIVRAIPSVLFSYRSYQRIYEAICHAFSSRTDWRSLYQQALRYLPLFLLALVCASAAALNIQVTFSSAVVQAGLAMSMPFFASIGPFLAPLAFIMQGIAEMAFVLGSKRHHRAVIDPIVHLIRVVRSSWLSALQLFGLYALSVLLCTGIGLMLFPTVSWLALSLASIFVGLVLCAGILHSSPRLQNVWQAFCIWCNRVRMYAVIVATVALVWILVSLWLSTWAALAICAAVMVVALIGYKGWWGLKMAVALMAAVAIVSSIALPASLAVLAPFLMVQVGYVYWVLFRGILDPPATAVIDGEEGALSSSSLGDAPVGMWSRLSHGFKDFGFKLYDLVQSSFHF